MGTEVRRITDALDAAGNTTAAIGKGFAIGSAAFVSLALFSGYMTILQTRGDDRIAENGKKPFHNYFVHVDLLHPFPFAGVLVGAMLPYWFTALTMASVGRAATKMVEEVRRQFREKPGILRGEETPDYNMCIEISTKASLVEMIAPGALVMGTPLTVGFLFGCKALAGVLIGALVSGIQIAISAANTGGAWDNAKKYIEQGKLLDPKTNQAYKKGSEAHKAAVVGDTVGDPLKDTSGPSLNILIKLMAVESLVFARAFPIHDQGLFGYFAKLIGRD
jgi:inorganic pyrophosphatase